MGKRR